ncbi:FAD-linked oxidase [Sphaerisporangium siamense]|uniref:FAD/FMN-containing dehydrogenase n=1 Tax=Sphaerisporangium siamense TaxID=795645 RepID=A0A7W7DAJ5_9ACTN|nr:BBE domain-containing protein [Sphaerisporangium siamense]MBB4703021.1 FAD/FMN-containing dehydrogenase [Sphaerisporangium siamense]GII83217.1 FAD-linked oxidase [Sphaerisporangium siamense]
MSNAEASSGVTVTGIDDRYGALCQGFNQRWTSHPDYIKIVRSTADVIGALNEALNSGRTRIAVRSGGHCYENFVSNAETQVIIDAGQMDRVHYDPGMGAYCVEAGSTNWHNYAQLYRETGFTLPAGSCYSVGAGGHICGGGYGLLSRRAGLTVDYLYAVEVVVVRREPHSDYRAEAVIARRDDEGHLRDLWWAHTGGGGGNFGVITRYWFKDLPRPPINVWLSAVAWEWKDMSQERFARLVGNFGRFCAENGGVRSEYADLFSILKLTHRSAGKIGLITQVEANNPITGRERLDAFLGRLEEGLDLPRAELDLVMGEHPQMPGLHEEPRLMPWIQATQTLNGSGPNRRGKYKSAYMRKPFPDDQIQVMWNFLSGARDDGDYDNTGYHNPDALIQVDTYGCRINAVGPRDTAVPQRDSIMKLQYQTYWTDPREDAVHERWIRELYRRVYQRTGGVPVPAGSGDAADPEAVTDGCYVNYPDRDLNSDVWNTSGVPWYRLYYGQNYERLLEVKQVWDPHEVFRHEQSIG